MGKYAFLIWLQCILQIYRPKYTDHFLCSLAVYSPSWIMVLLCYCIFHWGLVSAYSPIRGPYFRLLVCFYLYHGILNKLEGFLGIYWGFSNFTCTNMVDNSRFKKGYLVFLHSCCLCYYYYSTIIVNLYVRPMSHIIVPWFLSID